MWDIQILQNEVGTIDVLRLTAGAAAVPFYHLQCGCFCRLLYA
ncbi:MAG: hypothetical protein RNU03_00085 [Candidatus Sedimenticola sp. (ex Thyasira tokunagai)]